MDTMSILTWLGTIISIFSAAVSFWQAKKAKTAKESAEDIRVRLVDHREASELTHILTVCKKAQKSMEKYGPGSTPDSLIGLSPETPKTDAANVQEFWSCLKEQRAHFGSANNEADQFCEVLFSLLNEFAQASTPEKWREYGKQIVVHLDSICAVIKKQLDHKREMVS